MRLATIILISTMLQVSAASYGQYVTMQQKNVTLDKVFQTIRKQTGYSVLFVTNKIKGTNRIDADFYNMPVEKVLDQILSGKNLTYLLSKNAIIIKPLSAVEIAKNAIMAQISGTVMDEAGNPMPGVSVKVKSNTTRTMTNTNGKFSINASKDETLVFSYVGYQALEVRIGDETDIQVRLKPAVSALDEIVVVSYGKQRNRDITGSIAHVDASTLSDMPVGQFAQQLQGKVAGVQISQSSGQPGRGMDFRIRGAASLFAGSSPLFVIDGLPVTGSINNINPAEIESFTILKDASATALYGSRAANGVVLITTKHAKAGESKIDFSSYYGIQKIPGNKVPRMMNAKEFASFMKERYEDRVKFENFTGALDPLYANPDQYAEGTDWFNLVTRSAPIQSHDLTISSGTERSSTTAMLGYQNQQGVVINSGTELYSGRLNHSINLVDNRLKIGLNLAPSYRKDHNNRLNTDGLTGLWMWAMEASPLGVPQNPDGSYPLNVNTAGMVTNLNPYAQLNLIKDNYYTTRILGNAFMDFEFLKGLNLKTNVGVDKGAETRQYFAPSKVSTTGIAVANALSADNYSWTAEANLEYAKKFADVHSLTALVGYSAQKYESTSFSGNGQNFPTDDIPYLNAALTTSATGSATQYSLLSQIARVNYDYAGKYLFSAAVRRDGSSRFGTDRKFGVFPSASVGWIASDESFMKNLKAVNFLKLRASYGITGNNNIGNFTHISTISSNVNYVFGGGISPGVTVTGLGNTELAWERNKQLDLGLDIAFLDNRISFQYDYYNKLTGGMIQNRPIPRSSGYSTIRYNIGEFKFWGHEFSLNTNNLKGKLQWNTSLNVSVDRNEIKGLVAPGFLDYSTAVGANYFRNQVGKRLGQFYGFVNQGLYQNAEDLANSAKYGVNSDIGTIKVLDVNGDGVITDQNDRTFVGDPTPDFTFGLTNSFKFKNLDFGITMAGSIGGELMNVQKWTHLANMDGSRGMLAEIKDRWRSVDNPGSGIYPRTKTNTTLMARLPNSQWVEDGSYLTVKNVSLGYSFGLIHRSISKLRLYASVQQLFVFTGYSGMNPEANLTGLDATQGIGIDVNAYPIPRTFSFGISASIK